MGQGHRTTRRADDRLRREAARWFARLRGPDAKRHQRAFEAWREGDPQRAALYDRLLRRWDDAAVLGGPRTDPAGAGASYAGGRSAQPSGRLWGPAGLAGLAVGSAFLAIVVSPVRPAWLDAWPVPSLWSHRDATGIGEIRTVRLSDGSTITLDTDTALTTRFSQSSRRVSLWRGRARFDVAHDQARPFVVAAGGGTIAARGTLFDVSVWPNQKVAVTLIRGVVDVDPPPAPALRGSARRPSARLAAGQQFAFGQTIGVPTIQSASAAASLWPSGLLTFEGTPLLQAVTQANRYSQRRILLASPSLGDLRVSGVFRATAPRELAESLAAAFDLQLAENPAGDFVLARRAPGSRSDPAASAGLY